MALLVWDKDYLVGIKEIDNQHIEIVDIINKLYNLLDNGDRDEILQLLRKLNEVVDRHFETEERYMKEYKVFNIFSHKAQHNRLSKILDEHLEEFEEGNKELNETFVLLMRDWMVNHHKFHDKKMGDELIKKGVK